MSTNVSIILTLFDRNQLTERWLQFISENYRGSKIILADGNERPDIVAEQIKTFPQLDIQHVWIKQDQCPLDYLEKLKLALEFVSSKYVVIADNDDIIIEDNLISNVTKMGTNNLQIGICSQFRFNASTPNQITFELLDKYPFGKNNDDDIDLVERAIRYFPSDYLWYSIVEKEFLLELVVSMIDHKFNNWITIEMICTYIYSMRVNQTELLEGYLYRQEGTSLVAANTIDSEALANLIFDRNFAAQTKSMVEMIVSRIKNPTAEAIQRVEQALKSEITEKISNRFLARKYFNYRILVNIAKYFYLLKKEKTRKKLIKLDNDRQRIQDFFCKYYS